MRIGIPVTVLIALCACMARAANVDSATGARPVRGGNINPDSLCIVTERGLQNVAVTITPSGDTLVDGKNYHEVFPPAAPLYAVATDWYTQREPISFSGHLYFAYGPPRRPLISEVRPLGEYRGTPVFGSRQSGPEPFPDVLLVPLRPGCVFQLYSSGT